MSEEIKLLIAFLSPFWMLAIIVPIGWLTEKLLDRIWPHG